MAERVKTIHCLDGKTRRCERSTYDDGWIYIYIGERGTTLGKIPDSRLRGNREITEEEASRS